MTDVLLSLSTRIAPARKFLVDGEEFEMLTLDHLSPDEEKKVVALFARHGVLASELEMTANVQRGEQLADSVRKTRFQIIRALTTLPKETVEKLPLPAQVSLLTALQSPEEETPEETGEDPSGGQADD